MADENGHTIRKIACGAKLGMGPLYAWVCLNCGRTGRVDWLKETPCPRPGQPNKLIKDTGAKPRGHGGQHGLLDEF